MSKRCHPEGGCVPLSGKPWCAEHQERLDRVAAELLAEQTRMSHWTHYAGDDE